MLEDNTRLAQGYFTGIKQIKIMIRILIKLGTFVNLYPSNSREASQRSEIGTVCNVTLTQESGTRIL